MNEIQSPHNPLLAKQSLDSPVNQVSQVAQHEDRPVDMLSVKTMLHDVKALIVQEQVKPTELTEALTQLSQNQRQILSQIESLDHKRGQTKAQSCVNWQGILEQLSVPSELASEFESITTQQQALEPLVGLSPLSGWQVSYPYFDQVCQYLDSISALVKAINDDPDYLDQALETLRLRAKSRRYSQVK